MSQRLVGGRSVALFVLACFLSALPAPPIALAKTQRTIGPYRLAQWTTEDGLPQNTVAAMVQTRDGYLWLGTFGGLARFDGTKFTVFTSANTPGLADNRILALGEDHEGALWIATETGLLIRYRDGIFSRQALDPIRVHHIVADQPNSLWLATPQDLVRLKGGRVTGHPLPGIARDYSPPVAFDPRRGEFWIGRPDGLVRWNQGQLTTYSTKDGLRPGRVLGLTVGRSGTVWAATTAELARFTEGRFIGSTLPRTGEPLSVLPYHRSLLEDRSGGVWMAAMGLGLFRLHHGKWSVYTTRDGLPDGIIRSLLEDAEGNIWLGTDTAGLVRLTEGKLTVLAKEQGLPADAVLPIAEDHQGDIWIGCGCKGLARLPGGALGSIRLMPQFGCVWSLCPSRDGSLWIGAWTNGLFHLQDGKITNYLPTNSGLSDDTVLALHEDRQGSLWIGTRGGGLNRLRNGQFTVYRRAEGLAGDSVKFITEDREGALWIGTTTGLSRFQDGRFTTYTTRDGLSHDYVRAIHLDSEGVFWIGTYGGGLNRLRDGRFTPYTRKEGLFDDVVSRILEDDAGNFWMSGNRGIFRASRKALNDFAEGKTRSLACVAYGVADGMKTGETNGGGQPFGWRTRDGRLWFPTLQGVVIVDPTKLNTRPPPVVIEELLAGQKSVDLRPPIHVPPGKGDLEVHFAGLSYVAPEKVRFRYKLEGYDEDWIDAGERRVAYYTKLPPGSYRLRVLASNDDGVWNETGAALEFSLLPYFYQTRLFLAFGVMVALAAGWGGYQWRVRSLHQRLERERQVAGRLREVDKLKDEFLANTSHELRTPLHGIIGLAQSLLDGATGRLPEATMKNLSLIVSSAGRLAHLVNDILDFSRLKQHDLTLAKQPVDLRTLTEVTLALCRPQIGGKPLQLNNAIGDDVPPVEADENRLQQVMHNLVGNAIKFTASGSVTVSARGSDGMVEVTVSDTGIGISAAQLEEIFKPFEQAESSLTRRHGGTGLGLAVTRQLVELHGGRVWAESEPGRGSRFRFTLPISSAAVPAASPAAPVSRPQLPVEQPLPAGAEPVAEPAPHAAGATILVVDDEPVNIQVLSNYLRVEHYRVLTASGGAQALQLLQGPGSPPDLVLLDVMMPGMSGYEVCQKIRRRFAGNELPVIMVTARNQVADLVQGLASGANDYLGKPFSKDELLGRIRTHLELASATREVHEARDRLEVKVQERTAELRDANRQLGQLNDQLGRANDDMLSIFNQWRSGVITTDPAGRITFLSRATQRLAGRVTAEVVGRPWDQVIPLAESDKNRLRALTHAPPEQRRRIAVHLEGREGERYWAEVEVQNDPRDPQRRIFFLYDVSEVYDLRRLLDEQARFHGLIGESSPMQLVYREIRDVAKVETTVLIRGETGTGKELVARAIHYASPRRSRPFLAVNCAGLTESLVSSQLFGHKRGAFTGAVADQAGLFEAAQGGTLFLDEIGDIPLSVQTSLLRALQEKEITRLGETRPRPVEARFIAATHRDLERETAAGRFRQDLLYRIRVTQIHLPPLRDRREDIPALVAWYLSQFSAASGDHPREVSQEAMQALRNYAWPGNVRELRSAIESASIRARGPLIQQQDLPQEITGLPPPSAAASVERAPRTGGRPAWGDPRLEKKQQVVDALHRTGGNRAAAGQLLGISRSTLYLWIRELGIETESPAGDSD